MATAKQIIAKAREFLGVEESPRGSNNVVFNKDYYGYMPNNAAYHWCVTFVWDIFRMCGASRLFYRGKKTANCEEVDKWGREDGQTVSVKDAQEGDLVLFDWNANKRADHIGICVSNASTKITTIDGNSNDRVEIQTRDHAKVLTVIRPKYTNTETPSNCAVCPLRTALLELYNKLKEESTK